MKYVSLSAGKKTEPAFAEQVMELSQVNINRCYQCLTCSLSCPVSSAMDYLPHEIVRMVQLGDKSEVLQSSTIWICASCETCVTRCPNEIDIPRLMDSLRQMALEEKVPGKETVIPAFHQLFVKGIRRWGKQYELGMLLELKMKSKDLFGDIGLGMKMLKQGKLNLLPGKFKNRKELENIFKKTKRG